MELSLPVIPAGWQAAWVCLVAEGHGPGGPQCLLEAQAPRTGRRWQTPALQPVKGGYREDSYSLHSGGCSMWVCELWTPSSMPPSLSGGAHREPGRPVQEAAEPVKVNR